MSAKKFAMVHCRICGGDIDRNLDPDGNTWVMPSKKWYYHRSCYTDYKEKVKDVHSKISDDLWKDATWDFLKKDLKLDIDYRKMESQWNNFLRQGKTAKGIYFVLRYFYDVKHGDSGKCEKGIGIVPHIYNEGCAYWVERENREAGICQAIEQQIHEKFAQQTIQIVVSRKVKDKKAIDLSSIADMEDDE